MRYHAIVRGWLMDDAVLDYRWWKSAIKLPINSPADKAPQPAVTRYRGLATVENGGCRPGVIHHALWHGLRRGTKTVASTSFVASSGASASSYHRRQQAAICDKTAAPQAFCLSQMRLMLHASRQLTHPFTGQPLIIQAGLDETRMQALTQLAGVDFSLTMKGVEFTAASADETHQA